MDQNQTLLRAPKKKRSKRQKESHNMTINPNFNRDKFTLPLTSYIY